jgi:ABC-type glycerol-3-phosphate transport system permease component
MKHSREGLRRERNERNEQIILNAILIVALFLSLFPLLLTFYDSTKSLRDYENNMWFPSLPLRFYNYGQAWGKLSRYILNTLLVTLIGCGGMLFISSLASYAIGKIQFKGAKICFWIVLALMMLPGVLTLVPSSLIYKSLHLNNTYFALIFPIWTNGSLMSVFLFVTFFRSLPKEIFEAAEMDGAGEFRQYFSIAVPLSMPTVATCAIIQIISIWNDYLWPITIQSDEAMYTLPAGILYQYSNYDNTPEMYAAYMLAALPLLIVFVCLNKYYIKGLLGSAVKM